ncbi:unnamed protein product [Urochloa decumbens]|uniref:F-box domain-containing protein n=1 Tax=Urochloa decumbens TaxID=240449 RepID=A0ABC8WB25_9POAL
MAGGSTSNRKRRRSRKPNPAAQLTDDLLVEILARVPYRSLCRFRCVSTRWRALISDPDNRGRLPQTLAGFFNIEPTPGGAPHSTPTRYSFAASNRYSFAGVPGAGGAPPLIHPSLSFLPDREREHLVLVSSCNGLLCRCYRFPDEDEFDYLVIDPATEEWVAVPVDAGGDDNDDHDGDGYVLAVKIYSSAMGLWSCKKTGWSSGIMPRGDSSSVFVNGMMYFLAVFGFIGAVDVEGKTRRIIDCSEDSSFCSPAGFIHLSQGRLHLATGHDELSDKLEIWVLEDKDSEEWTLKHMISFNHLVRKKQVSYGFHDFSVVAFHPDRNMVFFVFGHHKKSLMSYDMDSRRVHTIHNLGRCGYKKFLPYVPLFSKSLPDGGNGSQ